jgi:NADH:ubiquinone oxidoreductase subunit 3 (subunit A)
MGSAEHPWLTVAGLLVGAVAFGFTPLALAWLWARIYSPQKPGAEKNATYECGLESKGDSWTGFDASYYLYGIVSAAFCGGVYWIVGWGLRGNVGIFAAAGGRAAVGLSEGCPDVGVTELVAHSRWPVANAWVFRPLGLPAAGYRLQAVEEWDGGRS